MTARSDRLTELLIRMREAYEIGTPLMVQQRLLADFAVCAKMGGYSPPRCKAPFSDEMLTALEARFTQETVEALTTAH